MIEREKHVVIHGQSRRFRVVKYIVISTLFIACGLLSTWTFACALLVLLALFGVVLHFVFRWKTKAWTVAWGPYKKMDLPK